MSRKLTSKDLRYTDESIMMFGKYKGYKLANVPSSYLRWWYESNDDIVSPLHTYICESGLLDDIDDSDAYEPDNFY